MPDVWHPVIELHGDVDHGDEYEAAEDYKDILGENDRVVSVDTGEGARGVYIERRFEDGGGGWVEVGSEANPKEDYFEVAQNIIDELDRDNVRCVFDYTHDRLVVEEWVEPE